MEPAISPTAQLPIPTPNASGIFPSLPQLPWAQAEDELDLSQLLSTLRRRAVAVTGVAAGVMALVTISTLTQTPLYQGSFKVLVEPVNTNNDVSDDLSVLTNSSNNSYWGSGSLDYETQIQVLRSPELMQEVVKELQQTHPDIDYGTVLGGLTIQRLGDTKILQISYQNPDPVKIQVTLDTLARVYLEYSLEDRQTNLRQGIQFIDKQMPELSDRVNDLQTQLQRFRQAYNFIDPDSQSEQISQQLQQLKQERLQLEQQFVQAQSHLNQLQSSNGARAALQDESVYTSLVQELRGVETELAAELTRFQPNSLPIQTLQEKRANLLPLLDVEAKRVLQTKVAEAQNTFGMLTAQRQALTQAEMQLEQTLNDLPQLMREYADLQRELEVATAALNRFLEARENLQIEAAQTEIPWEIIEAPSKPENPFSPNVKRSLLLGAVASLLLGVGAALLLEKLDTVFRTVEDLKQQTKLPLLGTVPHHPELEEATAASAQPWSILTTMNRWVTQHVGKTGHPDGQSGYYGYGGSRFLESLRLLNTNLQLLSSDRPFKSVILSSAMPGAGKSTIARNLAQTAATMGKRVLLIDIDLRKPTLHKRLNLSNHAGMSELLTGNATKAEVIQQALPFIEFYVITAGALPPDPIKLLASQRMHRLVEEFEQEFDLVVYDAPPLVGLADAPLLATHTDGLILISRIGRTDRNLLKHALDNLKMAKIPVLGVVANDVNVTSRDGYKYYSYGSYYETGQDQPPEAESEGVTTARQNNDGQFKTNGAVGLTVADIIQLNQPKK